MEFHAGQSVQFTLEAAAEWERTTPPKGSNIVDPFNDVFTVVDENSYGCTLLGKGLITGIEPEKIQLVGEKPRYIERQFRKRPSKDDYYLGIAKQVATRSTCLRRIYGAIIVKNDVIISTGYNGAPRDRRNCSDRGYCLRQILGAKHNDGNYGKTCNSVHAEQNAIINAARQGTSILGGTLYLYGYDCAEEKTIDAEPCPICSRMIQNTGIARIVSSKEKKERNH